MWKIRLTEECKLQIANSFLTLTYNDENLPKKGVEKNEIQLFIKKMRNHWKFRYYLISEYGPQTYRPHYHAILFGIDQFTEDKMIDKLEKLWGKGFVTLETVLAERLNYVAEYHILKGENPENSNKNFKLLSTKPAIGANYIEREKHFHSNEENMYYRDKKFNVSLPRYYKDKLYSPETIRKASILNQKQKDVFELRKLQKSPKYYQEIDKDAKHVISEYLKRKRKKKL